MTRTTTVLLLLCVPPLTAFGAATIANRHHVGANQKSLVFAFGRTGGNILPVRVSIFANGVVTVDGPVRAQQPGVHLSSDAIKGLVKLANAEKFFSLHKRMSGGLYPDSASLFIRLSSPGKARTVYLHATHNARFEELLALLMDATRVNF